MSVSNFKLYGIFGFPLGHTLSPVMQEAAFRALGWKAFYLPFEVPRDEFRRLVREPGEFVLDGFNVTVPYKEEVLPFLDDLSPSAQAMGAVNTVTRKGKRWIGFNTDDIGFIHSLEEKGKFQPRGKQVLILGAGGSARAVAYALAKAGAKQITIANRTASRARKIISEYQRLFPRVGFVVGAPLVGARKTRVKQAGIKPAPTNDWLEEIDLVVNATSVGLRPKDSALVRPRDFPRKTLFVDLIYRPLETRLLLLARQSGHRTLNGLGMLLYQGAEAFRLWTGRKAPVEVMREAIKANAH